MIETEIVKASDPEARDKKLRMLQDRLAEIQSGHGVVRKGEEKSKIIEALKSDIEQLTLEAK